MTLLLLTLFYFLISAFSDFAAAQNQVGCVTDVISNFDYFPDKVVPTYSKLWSISYHNTYKIVQNLDDNSTYLLYQCGTDPPSDVEANVKLSIPLQNGVALSTTVHIPHFELLGLRDEIKAYLGDTSWISSPCMKARIESGETFNIPDPTIEGAQSILYNKTNPDVVSFSNPGYGIDIPNTVTASEWKEGNNHGIGEWHKYIAVFYNKEAQANEFFQNITQRYDCTASNANYVISGADKVPKVVIAEFSTYCGGWSVGNCPSFQCEYVIDCSAEIIANDNNGSIVNPECGLDYFLKSTQEFVDFAKDADVWIYPGMSDYYFDTAYEDFGEYLDQMKSVQNKEVYDTVLTGLNTWYEHRMVEYDVVLEDMCNIVGAGHSLLPHERQFLRNVFTEAVGDLGECEDPSQGFEIRAEECVAIAELVDEEGPESSNAVTSLLALPAVILAFVNFIV